MNNSFRQNFQVTLKYSLAFIVTALILAQLINFSSAYTRILSDFTQDFLSAHALSRGQAIYDQSIIDLGFEFFGVRDYDNFHPPFVSLLVYPYAYFNYQQAASIQLFLILILYISIFVGSAFHFNQQKYLYFLLPLGLLWYPLIEHLGLVQISIFLSFAIFLAYLALKRNLYKSVGFCFALAALIKLYPLYFTLFLIATRKYKCLFWFIAFFLLGSLLAYMIVGSEQFWRFYLFKIPQNSFLSGEAPFNFSVYSILMYIFQSNKYSTCLIEFRYWKFLYYAFAILLSLPFLRIWQKKIKASESDLFFYTLISMLLLSPIVWTHMLVILVPLYFYYFSKQLKNYRLLLISLFFSALPIIPINQLVLAKTNLPMPWYCLFLLKASCLTLLYLLIFAYSFISAPKAEELK